MLNNLSKVLITQPLESREDLYAALGTIRGCDACMAPRNLDALADFLREHKVETIVASAWKLSTTDTAAVLEVLRDNGVRLFR
ncbi:hypothetical protein [Corynebacterium striatum]|uniref:hypothetical protein n=1 Tax=Corynebacterium striatum TaxID=43770 RepID=UPI000D7682CF|nr:hypothetical protein [Corynebacterium striatum]PXY06451.1 hypothetical protein CKF53_03990 [Corynebacterium striatum]